MNKIAFFACVLTGLVLAGATAQSSDPVTLSYQRNFLRANMNTKLELLGDAAKSNSPGLVQLYADALRFVNDTYSYLGNDSQLMDIAVVSATKAALFHDPSVLPALKSVFTAVPDSKVRIACLNAYASLAKGRADDIAFLNDWFSKGLQGSQTPAPDAKTLSICAATLGQLGDASSFPILFSAATGSYDSSVIDAASSALNAINDGYTDQILAIIKQKNVKTMYAAFTFAMRKDSLSISDRGKIAEIAFTNAVDVKQATPSDSQAAIAPLLKDSMERLTALSWTQASPAVVKYFYIVQGEYKSDKSGMETILPVIRCMGSMGTTEAAQALSIFLGLLNSETEQKKTYNEQLMLMVIQALGDLGDKTAFDYLLYIGYLDYPESVKKASRDALARLAW